MKPLLFCLVAMLVPLAPLVSAQVPPPAAGSVLPNLDGAVIGPFDDWNYGASTAFGSATRGLADVVRSQGAFNLLSSEAAINMTEARRRAIENAQEWAKTYFEMRQMNRAYRAAERGPRPTRQDWIRYAQAGKPERLSPSELDNVSGEINWPILLRGDQFEEYRAVLNRLFAAKAETGTLSPDGYLTIDRVTDAMKAQLQSEIEDLPPQDYVNARHFIESLAYEAKIPTG